MTSMMVNKLMKCKLSRQLLRFFPVDLATQVEMQYAEKTRVRPKTITIKAGKKSIAKTIDLYVSRSKFLQYKNPSVQSGIVIMKTSMNKKALWIAFALFFSQFITFSIQLLFLTNSFHQDAGLYSSIAVLFNLNKRMALLTNPFVKNEVFRYWEE